MLEFAYPWLALLLPLPLLVWWLIPPRRETVNALRAPFFNQVVQAAGVDAGKGSVVLRKGRLQLIVIALAWACLMAAAAKPQWVGEPVVRTETTRDIMLAIDLSGSMDYADFPDKSGKNVRRFEAVQRVVDEFVAARESDRIGLIVFGDRAFLQLPFTRDLQTARQLVALMDVGMAGVQTALGDAIGLSIRSFESSDVEERLMILLTDGNDTISKMTPVNAAEIAKLNGVEIHTIGVGNPDAKGQDRVDFDTLEEVARRTGGQFLTAGDEAALAAVYTRIDETTAGETRTQSWRPRESLVHWPMGAAMLLVLLLLLGCAVTPGRKIVT